MALQLPSPPFYQVSNLNNFRDAALAYDGLKTVDGKGIKPGILYRSAEVTKVDIDGWNSIAKLGVSRIGTVPE